MKNYRLRTVPLVVASLDVVINSITPTATASPGVWNITEDLFPSNPELYTKQLNIEIVVDSMGSVVSFTSMNESLARKR